MEHNFITHYELGLYEDDFEFEILNVGKNYYSNLSPFSPKQETTVKVNGYIFNIITNFVDIDNFPPLGYGEDVIYNCKIRQIEDVKFEAILKYVNSNHFLRKRKLEKINGN